MEANSSILRLCDNFDDFFNLSHLSGAITIVCPSPMIADSVSERINDPYISTVTISQFSREYLQLILGDSFQERFRRKSELNLILATSWKKQFGMTKSFSLYKQAFNLYTELRSYTVSDEVLYEVLAFYPQDIQDAIIWFNSLVKSLGILDEHEGYNLIKENARSSAHLCKTPREQNLIFWGFSYLSGVQVDMIKALAIRNHVEIPVTRYAYSCSTTTDWIQWFDLKENEVLSNLPKLNCKIVRVSKNRLASTISSFYHLYQGKQVDVLITDKMATIEQNLEIALPCLNFRSSVNFLEAYINGIFDKLIDEVQEVVVTDDIVQQLQEKIIGMMQGNSIDWKYIKAISVILDTIQEWQELSVLNRSVNYFDLKILQESALLNSTRNFYQNLVKEPQGTIIDLNGIDSIYSRQHDHWLYVCATSNYSRFNTSGNPFVKGVIDILKSIAPLRRYRLEFEILKEKICSLLTAQNSVLFIENGLEDLDSGWNEILLAHPNIRNNEINLSRKGHCFQQKKYLDLFEKKQIALKRITASKLQTYLDCPRKFYYQYVEPMETKYSSDQMLTPADLGEIEHLVIERAWENGVRDLFDEQYRKLVESVIYEYLYRKQLVIDEKDYAESLQEIIIYTQNGLKVLTGLCALDSSIKVIFEKEFSIQTSQGGFYSRPDCWINGRIINGILDFKRSSASVANIKEIKEFQKIQLPFYGEYALQRNIDFMAYLCLADISQSVFIAEDDSLLSELHQICGKSTSRIKGYLLEDKNEYFSLFNRFVVKHVDNLLKDSRFIAKYRNPSVCDYCSVRMICTPEQEQNDE